MGKTKVNINNRFGYVTVLERIEPKIGNNGHKISQYLCLCVCGETVVFTGQRLTTKKEQLSCGCKNKHIRHKTNNFMHGQSKTRLYGVWTNIISRCYNNNLEEYKHYGGRGIIVCAEWRNDFMAFHDWAYANGYDENAPYGVCTIDRIDTNGNYEPSNCRWTNLVAQNNNRRNNKCFTLNDKTQTLQQWSIENNIPYSTLRGRLNRGWSFEKAVTTTPQKQYYRRNLR